MGCRKSTCTWAQNLKVGAEYRQYTVQLVRQIGCFCEEYRIYVNGQEIEQHGLKYNPCAPLCCAGGEFEWEQDGHSFMLMFNSLSWTNFSGGFRLFIDGIDVNTGREFSAFWRRRGLQIVFVGLVILLIGIALSLAFHFAFPPRLKYGIAFGYAFTLTGLFDILWGLIPVIKYRNSKYDRSVAVKYTSSNAV
ncbi:PREDICTED: uncharacterized protein LOC107328409 [Acropora digitifera]|uniref:uncharacterized protein LOC107328409 n=1 Tax=Acropora digitifera TaxID=70779 RepID=UPI00077A59BC|nr:PREDICTED: uncharacterized protein LOC107328409 [Acropora digitifera]XP_015748634.1 PREDICTED: uncharacterized protein LOC107328409 [Acropora digitifera]